MTRAVAWGKRRAVVPSTSRASLAAAFSLRENLRFLLVPRAEAIPAATGLRALAMAWVLVQHVQQGLRPWGMFPAGAMFLAHPLLTFGWAGNLGVEIFFCLSGYLIGRMLFREHEVTGKISLRLFYWRRALRIAPTYLLALGVNLALPGVQNKEAVWANLLLVNNFIPFTKAFMAHTWSLAVEEQFYGLFPVLAILLLRTPKARRPYFLAGAVVLAVVLALAVVFGEGLELSLRAPNPAGFWRYMNVFYVKPYARFGAIALGVLVAELETRQELLAWLAKRAALATRLAALAVGVMLFVIFVFPEGRTASGDKSVLGGIGLALDGYGFALAIAYLLLLSRTAHPIGKALARVLGGRVLHVMAQLSFATFLFHPVVITPLYDARVLGFDLAHPFRSYALLLAASFVLAYAVAAFVFLAFELPLTKLRPPPRARY